MKKSFSLIEVVLACTVLILFLTAGIILFSGASKNIIVSKHRLQAIYLGNQKIKEITTQRDSNFFAESFVLPTNGSFSDIGGITLDGLNFGRNWVIENGSYGATSRKITATVTWTDINGSNSVNLYTYLTNWQS